MGRGYGSWAARAAKSAGVLLLLATAGCAKPSASGDAPSDGARLKSGVAECDAYAAKVEACAARRSGFAEADDSAFAAQRAVFKELAGTPDERRALADWCRAALDAIRPACGE